MLIESIKLENFRQFQNESITFADGSDGKNVTIILGENGSGKTTFAQAFFWCMYGETSFSDKRLLNSKVASKMIPGSKETVRVELCLKHGLLNYVLTREQVYVRDYTKLTPQNSVLPLQQDNLMALSYMRKGLRVRMLLKTSCPRNCHGTSSSMANVLRK